MKQFRGLSLGFACLFFLLSSGCGGVAPVAKQGDVSRILGKSNHFVIAGLITDEAGIPVGHLPVRVFSSNVSLQADPRLGLKNRKPLASGLTASDGTYRISLPPLAGRMKYYLNFYAQGLFDEVQYARPNRIDITKRVISGDSWLFDYKLAFHAAWPKVQETLKAYPPNSPRAKVIRRFGIAEEIRKGQKKGEVWWYYSKGKRFDFEGDKIISEKSFLPIIK